MDENVKSMFQISQELKEIKTLVLSLKKGRTELFKESWIDGQEVCMALKVAQRTLQTLRSSGLLPYSQFNGKCYYKVSDLEALLESSYSRNRQSKSHD